MIAAGVNHAWWCAARLSAGAMRRALHDPEDAQRAILRSILRSNARTVFGREHDLDSISSPEELARRVPIRRYDDFTPWIDRIAQGEPGVLTSERVTRLIPSSGSTAARKLIPFTRMLGRQFTAAIHPWIDGLFTQRPDLARGRAYWSITPAITHEQTGPIPIGFDDDSAYLGGFLGSLMGAAMAVPAAVSRIQCIDDFRHATLLSLLRCRDLRLISVWHPSFLTLLLDDLPARWDALLTDVQLGTCALPGLDGRTRRELVALPDPQRARLLARSGPYDTGVIWPSLGVVSCWADAGATGPAAILRERLARVPLQAKGLLATEGVVTFPLGDRCPLAVRSHFFEFLDEKGTIHLAHELRVGGVYEVLLTTGGGLYRYRLGDLIRVDGYRDRTPSARIVGRADSVSDLVGEKLSEAFVGSVLDRWFALSGASPSFSMLAPNRTQCPPCYTLYTDAVETGTPGAAATLDQLLRANPQYEWARRAGQLAAVRLFRVNATAFARYSDALVARGMRLGDIKPTRLSISEQWSHIFSAGRPAEDRQAPA